MILHRSLLVTVLTTSLVAYSMEQVALNQEIPLENQVAAGFVDPQTGQHVHDVLNPISNLYRYKFFVEQIQAAQTFADLRKLDNQIKAHKKLIEQKMQPNPNTSFVVTPLQDYYNDLNSLEQLWTDRVNEMFKDIDAALVEIDYMLTHDGTVRSLIDNANEWLIPVHEAIRANALNAVNTFCKYGVVPVNKNTITGDSTNYVHDQQGNVINTITTAEERQVDTLLTTAVIMKNIEIISVLCSYNADPTVIGQNDKSALDHAMEWGNKEVIELLEQQARKLGKDVSIQTNSNQN